jgi:hypothetical protein
VQQEIESAADALLLPLVGETWRDLSGSPRAIDGPALTGDGLLVSAVHLRSDGHAIVLRAINTASHDTSGAWILPDVARWRMRYCRLDGEPLSDWIDTGPRVSFSAAPRATVTIEVDRGIGTNDG